MRLLLAFPVLRIILPFMVGVIAGAFLLDDSLPGAGTLYAFGGIWLLMLLGLALWPKGTGVLLHGITAQLAALLGGVLLVCSVSDQLYPTHLSHRDGAEGTWLFTVDGEPQDKPRSIAVRGTAISADGGSFGRVLLYLSKDSAVPGLAHGDRILFSGRLNPVRPSGNPNEFNYARYLRFHHIHHQTFVPSGHWEFVQQGPWSLRRFFISLRGSMLDVLRRSGLSGDDFAVAAALVLGYKADLEQSLVQAYAGAGATHVLAVSGLHVGIIYVIISGLLGFLTRIRHGERVRAGITVLLLVCYAMLTGLSPSVTRAVTMFSFVAVAKSLNRRGSIYNTLACSAIGLVILDPLIVMQVGFQLSYAAVLGIVLFQPPLTKLLKVENKWGEKVWEITCVSVAAQVSTFPLGLLYFHQFPNLFFVSNLFVIPAATLVLKAGLAAMVAQLWEPLLRFVGLVLHGLIGSMNWFVALFDRIPYAVTGGIDISIAETVLIYVLIGTVGWMFIGREVRMALPTLAVAVLLAVTQT
jgi:competence protein ComEC